MELAKVRVVLRGLMGLGGKVGRLVVLRARVKILFKRCFFSVCPCSPDTKGILRTQARNARREFSIKKYNIY